MRRNRGVGGCCIRVSQWIRNTTLQPLCRERQSLGVDNTVVRVEQQQTQRVFAWELAARTITPVGGTGDIVGEIDRNRVGFGRGRNKVTPHCAVVAAGIRPRHRIGQCRGSCGRRSIGRQRQHLLWCGTNGHCGTRYLRGARADTVRAWPGETIPLTPACTAPTLPIP